MTKSSYGNGSDFRNIVIVIISTVILSFVGNLFRSSSVVKPNFEKELKSSMRAYNKKLPIMVDEITRLTRVTVSGKEITYKNKVITVQVKDLNVRTFHKKINKVMIQKFKSDPNTVKFLNRGVVYIYEYRDKHSKMITSIRIDKKACHL